MTTVRITFWFKGTMDRHKTIDMTVDLDIDANQTDEQTWITNRAFDALSTAITHGLIDHFCDHAVEDFGIESISFEFKGKADLIY